MSLLIREKNEDIGKTGIADVALGRKKTRDGIGWWRWVMELFFALHHFSLAQSNKPERQTQNRVQYESTTRRGFFFIQIPYENYIWIDGYAIKHWTSDTLFSHIYYLTVSALRVIQVYHVGEFKGRAVPFFSLILSSSILRCAWFVTMPKYW